MNISNRSIVNICGEQIPFQWWFGSWFFFFYFTSFGFAFFSHCWWENDNADCIGLYWLCTIEGKPNKMENEEKKEEEEWEEGTTIEKVDDFEIQMKSEVYAWYFLWFLVSSYRDNRKAKRIHCHLEVKESKGKKDSKRELFLQISIVWPSLWSEFNIECDWKYTFIGIENYRFNYSFSSLFWTSFPGQFHTLLNKNNENQMRIDTLVKFSERRQASSE